MDFFITTGIWQKLLISYNKMHCLLPSAVTSVVQIHGSKQIIYSLSIEQIVFDVFLNDKEIFFSKYLTPEFSGFLLEHQKIINFFLQITILPISYKNFNI